MDLPDNKSLLSQFERFFEENMKKQIREALHQGSEHIEVDFFDILEHDPELGDVILAHPEECLRSMEDTLKHFFLDGNDKSDMRVRLTSLPETEKLPIRSIRSAHLKKLIMIEGIVRRKTDVRPRLTEIHFMCIDTDCVFSEQHLVIHQIEEKVKIQKSCPRCRSEMKEVEKILIDAQHLVLEEGSDQLDNQGDQPKRMNILLMGDLVSPFKESKTNPGSRVYVIGFVKEIANKTRTGADSINYDLVIDANYIGMSEEDYTEITPSKEEEKEIKALAAKSDVMDILINNISPSIYGHERIKEAILLQLFGGAGAMKGDGTKVRGDIHILLIGDPGAAKSQLLKAASKIAPKSSFVSGKSASGVGLTASVVKDEMMRGFALEAGAMVLASGGLCAIDELDKMSEDDTSAMHEALEQQTISIAKANIRATLRCETTVLGAANPKLGRFDPYGDIAKQINFPPALMSRFDLIFIIKDIPDKKRDDMIASHILKTHKNVEDSITSLKPEFLKKYIAYAKRLKPKLTDEAIEKIKEFYISIRNAAGEDEGPRAVPITPRQLEAIVRLAEAYAKIKLEKKVRLEHAQLAIDLLMYCLEKIGIDPKTGQLDIDRITTGVTTSTRNQFKAVQMIIDKLENEKPDILFDDICIEAEKQKIARPDVDKILHKLKEEGIIFEPRKNLYKKLL